MDRIPVNPADIASPCVGICELLPDEPRCRGCLRTTEEIARWPDLSAAEKLALLALLSERRAALREGP